jgi:fructose-1,6-bisphosphatase/inositol monophosphatase family enzyme
MVAAGQVDAAVLLFGSLWDFAGPSLIVGEAGGVFRDAWGGERFDTHSGVFTNPALLDDVLSAPQPADGQSPRTTAGSPGRSTVVFR